MTLDDVAVVVAYVDVLGFPAKKSCEKERLNNFKCFFRHTIR